MEHTPSNLYQQAFLAGNPFIIGVAGGLPKGCAISGCVAISLDYPHVVFFHQHVVVPTPPKTNECSLKRYHFHPGFPVSSNHQFSGDMAT